MIIKYIHYQKPDKVQLYDTDKTFQVYEQNGMNYEGLTKQEFAERECLRMMDAYKAGTLLYLQVAHKEKESISNKDLIYGYYLNLKDKTIQKKTYCLISRTPLYVTMCDFDDTIIDNFPSPGTTLYQLENASLNEKCLNMSPDRAALYLTEDNMNKAKYMFKEHVAAKKILQAQEKLLKHQKQLESIQKSMREEQKAIEEWEMF